MINVALFGFGRIGQMHGSNLFKHPKFNLKYVYDKDEKLAKKSERMFKAKSIKNYKTSRQECGCNIYSIINTNSY